MGMLAAATIAFPALAAVSAAASGAAPQAASFDSPYAARNGAEFVTACDSDRASCDGKVADTLMSWLQYPTGTHICLSGPSYARAVPGWLKAHLETAGMNAEEAIVLALSVLYKCGPPNNY